MKNINNYIFEKLHLNKDIEIKNEVDIDVFEKLPDIGSRVLLVYVSRKSTRDDYVKFDVCEVYEYENNNVLLKKLDSNDVLDDKFRIIPKKLIDFKQQKTVNDYYFAEFKNPNFYWSRVFTIKRGLAVLSYARKNLHRGLKYVYSGYKFDCPGNDARKDKELYYIKQELEKL